MRKVELVIDEDNLIDGYEALSVVDLPAIEENFVALSRNANRYVFSKLKEGFLIGPALVPNKDILRVDQETGEEFEVFFTPETVKKVAYQMMSKFAQKRFTADHESKAQGLTIVESWIIEDEKNDKSKKYGFKLKPGTWMVKVAVDNDKVRQRIENGELKGFSIEAFFTEKALNFNKLEEVNDIVTELKNTQQLLNDVL